MSGAELLAAEPVLVDTSVFIDFLRPPGASRKNDLQSLLEERRVVVSPLIRLELLQGVRSSDRKQLSTLLDALPSLQVQPELFETAEILLPTTRKQGLLTGLIDYLLVIQALLADVSLYTFDKTLKRVARGLEVPAYS